MKKTVFVSLLLGTLLLTGCGMWGRNDMPMADPVPTDNAAPTDKASESGTPEATASMQGAGAAAVSEADAKKIALEKVPGAQESDIHGWKLDRDDGRQEYEGKIIFEKTEYEFEIDAATGEVISWESESVHD